MPRKRTVDITESLEELRRLAADLADTHAADPLRVLVALRKNPTATNIAIATMTDCTPRDVERWLAVYRAKGMEGLLADDARAGGKTIRPHELQELREAMSSGELETLEEIRAWIAERFGLRYTTRGIGKLVQREFGARRGWVFGDGPEEKKPATTVEKMLRFLNSLTITGESLKDGANIRSALQKIFTDVDRVSLYICVASREKDKEDLSSLYRYLVIVDEEIKIDNTNKVTQHLEDSGIKPSDRILKHFREQNMPIDQYHPPVCHDYYNARKNYIGSAIFWSSKTSPKISKQSKILIENLDPFITFLFSVSRTFHEFFASSINPFSRMLDTFSTQFKLSPQEHRVAWFRLLGHSYQEIADALHISKSTVHKHLTSVHRKTGTSSIVELFARYFTPRMEARRNDDRDEG